MPNNELNYSQLASWQRCRYAWHLTYARKIRKRFEGVPISIGTAVHIGLAAELRGDKLQSVSGAIEQWYNALVERKLTDEENTIAAIVAESAVRICHRALKVLDIGNRFVTLTVDGNPMVERTFYVPLDGWGVWDTFRGTVDWIALEVDTGRVWLVDHKVRAAFLAEEYEVYNIQMALYSKLLSECINIPVYGSIMHQLKSAAPREPKVNKNGTVSRQLILTDWETYRAVCVQNGQNPDDYLDMKDKLDDVEWYRLTRAYWPNTLREQLWENTKVAAREIGYACGVPRSVSWMNCVMCKLKTLCMAELHGDDTEFLMKTEYQFEDEETYQLPDDFDAD